MSNIDNVNITNDYGDIILNQASVADIKESAGDVAYYWRCVQHALCLHP